jgi:phosphonate transport system permease protein
MAEFATGLFTAPDWRYLPDLSARMLETVEIAVVATVLAALVSFPLGLLAAQNTTPWGPIGWVAKGFLALLRAVPEVLWALLFVAGVGLGVLPGVMAITVATIGFLGKFFAESFEVVPTGPIEGVAAHGASHLAQRTFGVLPLAMPDVLGQFLYGLDSSMRFATILGYVGAGGIGFDMMEARRLFKYDRLIMIIVAVAIVIALLDWLSDAIRRRLV